MDLRVFIPILWAMVGAGVGLGLYKSSRTVFKTKGVVITGSAVIASLAFYGMYRATPGALLRTLDQARFASLSRLSVAQERQIERALAVCVETAVDQKQCHIDQKECHDMLSELQVMGFQIGDLIRGLKDED